MSSLLELSPQHRDVHVGSNAIPVYGWSAEAIADLLASYRDEIRGVAEAFKTASDEGQTFQQIITGADAAILDTLSQSVIPTAVVWATRLPRTSAADILKAEGVVRDLPFTTQLLFLKTAYDLTFPEGVSDFLTALGLAVAQDESATS
ncbi:MAG: hypothetical protein ACK4ZU_03955 [Allorhizobium sp.]